MANELVFTCPYCQSQTLIPSEYLGQAGPCHQCQRRVEIRQEFCSAPLASSPTIPRSSSPSEAGGQLAKSNRNDAEEEWNRIAQQRARERRRLGPALRSCGLALLLVAGVAGLAATAYFVMLPLLDLDEKGEANRETGNSLAQVAAALRSYHDDYGSFPPAVVYDSAGRPLQSWRALLIPYLPLSDEWKNYRLDQPWNSIENSELHSVACPPFEGSQQSLGAAIHQTVFMAVLGERTMFSFRRAMAEQDAVDGTDRTMLIIEVNGSRTHWLEPVDLLWDEVLAGQGIAIGSEHRTGFWYATVDGKTHWHAGEIDPEDLMNALDRQNGLPRQAP